MVRVFFFFFRDRMKITSSLCETPIEWFFLKEALSVGEVVEVFDTDVSDHVQVPHHHVAGVTSVEAVHLQRQPTGRGQGLRGIGKVKGMYTVVIRDVIRFGPKWDNPGTFSDQISKHFEI